MNSNTRILTAICLAIAAGATSAGEECVGLEKLFADVQPKVTATKLREKMTRASRAAPPAGVECSSLRTVIKETAEGQRWGGRRLEETAKFDEAAARKNLEEAMADADVRQQFAKLKEEVPDDTLRHLYEAAVLDAAGFYTARTLLVMQARKEEGATP